MKKGNILKFLICYIILLKNISLSYPINTISTNVYKHCRTSISSSEDMENKITIKDDDIIHSETKVIEDQDGIVRVNFQWLRRPGEMALEILYYGYLIQEGTVNFYININGVQREFMTLLHKEPLSYHKIRIISFYPIHNENGVNKIKNLKEGEVVDKDLFKNAAYYSCFGKTRIEVKFFAHGRWDGDGNNGNSNYVFEFESPIKE